MRDEKRAGYDQLALCSGSGFKRLITAQLGHGTVQVSSFSRAVALPRPALHEKHLSSFHLRMRLL
jgi:hypothetical protein